MSFLIFIDFAGGKYLVRKALTSPSHVVIILEGNEINHALALLFRENGNNQSLIASSITPLCLKVSQISKKFAICRLGSSLVNPPN